MKKYLALLLALTLLFTLASCRKEDKGTTTKEEKTSEEERGDKSSSDTNNGPGSAPGVANADSSDMTAGFVLYDDGGIKITTKKLQDSEDSVNLDIEFINRSEDFIQINIGYEERNYTSINGFMFVNTPAVTRLEPGQQATNTIYFDKEKLALLGIRGIEDIADIGLGLEFLNKDYELLKTEFREIKTAHHSSYDYSKDAFQDFYSTPEEVEKWNLTVEALFKNSIYDVNGIKHLSTVLYSSADGLKTLYLEFENTGKEPVILYDSDLLIDGLSLSNAKGATVIMAGKKAVLELDLDSGVKREFWEKMGIYGIGRVSFNLGQSKIDEFEPGELVKAEFKIYDAEVNFDMGGNELYTKDGIRVVEKLVDQSEDENSADYYIYLGVENKTQEDLRFDVLYDSVKLDGKTVNYWCDGLKLKPGETGVLGIIVPEVSLRENKIDDVMDIAAVDFTLLHQSDYEAAVEVPLRIMLKPEAESQ